MKKILFFILPLFTWGAYAQTHLYKTSLAPSGGSANSGAVEMVYTVGEVFVSETNSGTKHLSEGFLNADMLTLMNAENFGPLPGVEIYPNPVKDILKIRLETHGTYEIYIFDLTGKQLFHSRFEGTAWQVDMRNYRQGFYVISVVDRSRKRMTSIKIQKI